MLQSQTHAKLSLALFFTSSIVIDGLRHGMHLQPPIRRRAKPGEHLMSAVPGGSPKCCTPFWTALLQRHQTMKGSHCEAPEKFDSRNGRIRFYPEKTRGKWAVKSGTQTQPTLPEEKKPWSEQELLVQSAFVTKRSCSKTGTQNDTWPLETKKD